MSKAQILEGLLELSVEERLEVLEVGWESVTRARDAAPVSDELCAMLRERLATYRADPADTLSWDEVESCLRTLAECRDWPTALFAADRLSENDLAELRAGQGDFDHTLRKARRSRSQVDDWSVDAT